jgi:tetratricopeptide (TPR) repeat protein
LGLLLLAGIKRDSGDFSGAKKCAQESQRAANIVGDIYTEASALDAEASCWFFLGSYGRCLPLLENAIRLLDLCGMLGGTVHNTIRITQAEVHRCKSEYVEARTIQTHLLQNASPDQVPYSHALALINIAQIDVEIGSFPDEAQQNINTAALLFRKANLSVQIIWCDIFRAALDVQQGNMSAARSSFQKCLRSARTTDIQALAYCLENLGAAQQWGAADHVSFSWTVTFLAHSFKCKERLELHKALQFLADVFWAQGDQDTAINLFTVALDGFTQMDVHRSKAECMVRLGDFSKLDGDQLNAAKLWGAARPLFERSSQTKQLTELDVKLAQLSHNQARISARDPGSSS